LQTQTHILSELKELHAARQALVKDRTAAKNRSKNLVNPLLKRQNADHLRQIESQLKAITEAIITLVSNDQTLKARYDILVSIPGLSQITAFALLIEIPELGELDEKAAAALSDLAPMTRQS
jgi:transposase